MNQARDMMTNIELFKFAIDKLYLIHLHRNDSRRPS